MGVRTCGTRRTVPRQAALRRVFGCFADRAVEDVWEFGRHGVEGGWVDLLLLSSPFNDV